MMRRFASWWWLAPGAVWLLAAVAAGGSPAVVLPPLLLLVVQLQVIGGWRLGAAALLAGWLGVSVWLGFRPLPAYGALATAALLATLEATAAGARRERRSAAATLRLVHTCLAALRAAAEIAGDWDASATLPGSARQATDPGLALWRTAYDDPELLAGGTGPADAAAVETLVRRATAAGTEVHGMADGPPSAGRVSAFPVMAGNDVGLVITLARPGPLSQPDRAFLTAFALTLAPFLGRVHEAWAGRLALDVVRHALGHAGGQRVESILLEVVLRETGLAAGAVLRYRAGRFVAEAVTGELPEALAAWLRHGIDFGDSPIWGVRRQGTPLFVADCDGQPGPAGAFARLGVAALALVPVGGEGGVEEAVMALFHPRPRRWPDRVRALLDGLASVLRVAMVQRDAELRLSETVRLQRELLATPVATMYQRVLEAAMRMVSSAEAGSLLVRGDDGRFRYVAAVGYALEGLTDLRLGIDAMRVWYGEDDAGWAAGEPRVLVSTSERSIGEVSARTTPRERMRDAGRVDEIVTDLCLPIIYRGEVLAVLNLDSMHDPAAFGDAAARAASDLAPVIGFLLHEAGARTRLDRVAHTDELTGLGNRRAFNEQATRELARANRHGHPLTLVVMDLTHFKAVNDAFGHAAGDEALRAVAKALRTNVRAGDSAFRWGGDEFAVLLPHADLGAARGVAGRIADAVARLPTPGAALLVNAGGACAPADGSDLDALISCADDRMYRAKALGSTWLESDARG